MWGTWKLHSSRWENAPQRGVSTVGWHICIFCLLTHSCTMSVNFYDHVYIGETFSSWVPRIEIQVQKKTAVHVDSDYLLVEPWSSGVPRRGGEIREHTSVCNFASVIGEGLEFDCPVSWELSLPLWVLVLFFCSYSYDGDFSFYSSFVLCTVSPTSSFSFVASPFCMDFTFLSLSYS